MIWFGNLQRLVLSPAAEHLGFEGEAARMQYALERVAESSPGLYGPALLDALAETGWVDRPTAARLLPLYRHFDADRHFGEYLRRLSFRGSMAADEFRNGVKSVFDELTGGAFLDQVGEVPCVRFTSGDFQGVVLAQPEVGFTIGGKTREAIVAAVDEMPDALIVVARNFEHNSAQHLATLLSRTGVPGTLITVNLLLGIRATTLRYQPPLGRVVQVLAAGGTLRSADVARLGDRAA